MINYMPKPVVFNLDDFCEKVMNIEFWDLIHRLKDKYPLLKVTMFTIPLWCSEEWLAMVKEEYPWIEMHYHGSNHKDKQEWVEKTEFDFPFGDFFYRGFKAPWWRLGPVTGKALLDNGYLLSTCKGYFDIEDSRVYRFNEGKQRIHMVWYERDEYHSVHSHVQHQKTKDGLPDGDLHKCLMEAFPKDTEFKFISEVK